MKTDREVMRMALEALTGPHPLSIGKDVAITALKSALEAEPQAIVAWVIYISGEPCDVFLNKQHAEDECTYRNETYPDSTRQVIPLFTAPQPRRELSDAEICEIGKRVHAVEGNNFLPVAFARAILSEAAK